MSDLVQMLFGAFVFGGVVYIVLRIAEYYEKKSKTVTTETSECTHLIREEKSKYIVTKCGRLFLKSRFSDTSGKKKCSRCFGGME